MTPLTVGVAIRVEKSRKRPNEEETLAITRRVMGPEHPDTLRSMGNLAETLRAQHDLVGSRKLQEEKLAIRRRMLGLAHPETSVSARNLHQTLQDLGEHERASVVLERDMRWLLDRDPPTLGADQREIREYVAQQVKKDG